MLYNKALHWMILINVPYFVVLSPVIDYLSFQFMYFVMRNFYSKSVNSSEIGHFLMMLMNITFWINIIFLGLWFVFPRVHMCGPIPDKVYGWKPFEEYLVSGNFGNILYTVVTFYPVLWNITSILILLTMFSRNKGKVYKMFIRVKKEEQ